ncbi:SCO family protein [Prosthecomicrobium pneumaticum]|uniref:Protein SCO1/2 n=1 Tax=Prosthecomicrobium pneumaticum TaxID=81895 RepID=A0A7W9FL11_9HYPH|nr:SCO family protein [Prosthecomicrobium pneumaticum]MBB5752083.1 protein SCO1/2 [Prosthecomicrobium pneumaticum]
MTQGPGKSPAVTLLRIVRYLLWAAIVVLVLAVGAMSFSVWQAGKSMGLQASSMGGPFSVVDTKGERVTQADLEGHPSVLFFGFTFCPEVCPTTLYETTQWLKALGPDADRLKVYFVTVDPERDTQEQMAAYLSAFDPRIVGLTGSRPEIDGMLKAWRVYSRKVPLDDGDYTMDHTATVYLLDRDARLAGTIDYKEAEDTALAKLKRLIAG